MGRKWDDNAIQQAIEDFRSGRISEFALDRRIAKAQHRIGEPFNRLWQDAERQVDDAHDVLCQCIRDKFDTFLMPLIDEYIEYVTAKLTAGIARAVGGIIDGHEKLEGHTDDPSKIADIADEIKCAVDKAKNNLPNMVANHFKAIVNRIKDEGW